jgi:hypothetical protein
MYHVSGIYERIYVISTAKIGQQACNGGNTDREKYQTCGDLMKLLHFERELGLISSQDAG